MGLLVRAVSNGAPTTITGRDVVPNVPDQFGRIGVRTVGADAAESGESRHGYSSFSRREETKWDAEGSIPPLVELRLCPSNYCVTTR